jgi:protein arginine N-methyltransferase 7
VNLVVADLFDSGVTGYSIEWMLQMARKNVVQPGATVIPAAATLYCVGIEAFTDKIDGMDMSSLDKYRYIS